MTERSMGRETGSKGERERKIIERALMKKNEKTMAKRKEKKNEKKQMMNYLSIDPFYSPTFLSYRNHMIQLTQ